MWLDLKDIIEMPGSEKEFECVLDTAELDFPSVERFIEPPTANGKVTNTAGVLTLTGQLRAVMLCICDRCSREFEHEKLIELNVPLSADMEDEGDDPDVFPVDGNGIELDEVLQTCFILEMDTKLLCRPDCRGLCGACGKNLNDGPCSCKASTDPRLAVLGQLLDIKD